MTRIYECRVVGDVMTVAVTGLPDIVVNRKNLSEGAIEAAFWQGLRKRVTDGAALERDSNTGLSATPAAKHARMTKIAEHLNSGGAWAMGGVGGGISESTIITALARAKYAGDEAATRLAVDGLVARKGGDRKEVIAGLAATPTIVRELAAMKAERIGVDADDLLDDLDE